MRKCNEKDFFCGYNNLTEGVLVTQISGNVGTSVLRILCVTTNFLLLSEVMDRLEHLSWSDFYKYVKMFKGKKKGIYPRHQGL